MQIPLDSIPPFFYLYTMKITTFKKAEEYLFSRRAKGMKLGMENIRKLIEHLDHPEKNVPAVHIAGTNGKGSTASIMEAVLRAAGYKTGLFTSPHLVDMRERIRINGKKISSSRVLQLIQTMQPGIEAAGATFFEILTAMGFMQFTKEKADIAVLETGLGGRLDATSVVTPEITIITSIGRDHTGILGNELQSIAREKAGIFKQNIPCITGVKDEAILEVLHQQAAPLNVEFIDAAGQLEISEVSLTEDGTYFSASTCCSTYKKLHLALLGRHQVENAGLVLLAVDELRKKGWKISESAVRQGFRNVIWAGRLQMLQKSPKIVIDSAHNDMGARTLVNAIEKIFQYNRLLLVFGVLRDKDYESMLSMLTPLSAEIYLTRPLSSRAVEPVDLANLNCFRNRNVHVEPDISRAWQMVKADANPDDLIIAAGSLYFAGEVLRIEGETNPAILP